MLHLDGEDPAECQPRKPSADRPAQVVRDHFETFRAQAAGLRDGEGLPRFVKHGFFEFLRCGRLAKQPRGQIM